MTLIIDDTYIDLIDINKINDNFSIDKYDESILIAFNYTDVLYNLFSNIRNKNNIFTIINTDIIKFYHCYITSFDYSIDNIIYIQFNFDYYEIKQDLIIMRKLKLKKLFNYINN